MRIICWLFGCDFNHTGPCCRRCGEHLYEGDVIQSGYLTHLKYLYWRFKNRLFGARCEICGRRLRDGQEYYCSDECGEKWIPF